MTKLLGYLIGLFVMFNTFNGSIFKDLEKLANVTPKGSSNINFQEIQSAFKELDSLGQEYNEASKQLDELTRIDYIIGNNTISFDQLVRYFNLKIQKLNTPNTKALLYASYSFLFLSLLSFGIALALFIIFMIKIIITKNRLEYLKERTRILLVRLGSFSCGFVFSLMVFLRFLNA